MERRQSMQIEIVETSLADVGEVKALWGDGEVMKFVGFAQGLKKTDEEMTEWLDWIEKGRPQRNHYSIYENGKYCGESFYNIDPETKSAALDIKLRASARGRGIAAYSLLYAIEQAFENGAEWVWVNPNPENADALALYGRIGMEQKKIPPELYDPDYSQLYFELRKNR